MRSKFSYLRPEELSDLIPKAEAEGRSPEAVQRLRAIVSYLTEKETFELSALRNGISTSSLEKWLSRFDPFDLKSLEDRKQLVRGHRVPETPPEVVELIRQYRLQHPKYGKSRIAKLLSTQHGWTVSTSTVGRVITRENLFFARTPLHRKKRRIVQQPHANLGVHRDSLTGRFGKIENYVLYLSMGCNFILAIILFVLFVAIAYSYTLTRITRSIMNRYSSSTLMEMRSRTSSIWQMGTCAFTLRKSVNETCMCMRQSETHVAFHAAFLDLISEHLLSGWEEIQTEEIGALTSSLLLSNTVDRDTQGSLLRVERVSWIPLFQVMDEIAELRRREFVIFHGEANVESTDKLA